MPKKGKKEKKEKINHDKTKAERVKEVITILKKFRELEIPDETPALLEFKEVTRDFIETGYGSSGKIKMPEYDRIIQYILTNHNLKESSVTLKYHEFGNKN